MQDTPPTDAVGGLGAFFGTALAFVLAAYGAFMAKRAKKEHATTDPENAGIVMGFADAKIQEEILEETRATREGVDELVRIKHEELKARAAAAEEAEEQAEKARIDKIEQGQQTTEKMIAALLKRLDERDQEKESGRQHGRQRQITHRDQQD